MASLNERLVDICEAPLKTAEGGGAEVGRWDKGSVEELEGVMEEVREWGWWERRWVETRTANPAPKIVEDVGDEGEDIEIV